MLYCSYGLDELYAQSFHIKVTPEVTDLHFTSAAIKKNNQHIGRF